MSTAVTALCTVKLVPRTMARMVVRTLSRSNGMNEMKLKCTGMKQCCGGALLSSCRTSKRAILTSHGSTVVRLQACIMTGVHPEAATSPESTETPVILSKEQARELAIRLTPEERDVLISALQESQSQKAKAEYEGQLAAFRWRSKFGRPSRVPSLGDVDPTGTYCAVPEDWLLRKYVETVPQPTKNDLFRVSLTNAIPFVGFGFLDNFFMIIAGDQIETSLGAVISLSTMAAAAFGNTISDILGIGSAFYVERLVQKIGFKAPKLTPIQMDLPKSRRAANLQETQIDNEKSDGLFPMDPANHNAQCLSVSLAGKQPVAVEINDHFPARDTNGHNLICYFRWIRPITTLSVYLCLWLGSNQHVARGRVLGVTIGCLLGMTPLLVLHKGGKDKDKDKEAKETEAAVKANA